VVEGSPEKEGTSEMEGSLEKVIVPEGAFELVVGPSV
jgi:hypothetical protein